MTVSKYLSLVESGFFGDRRVELWEGWVVDRMSHGSLPCTLIMFLAGWIVQRLPEGIMYRNQMPIQLAESCPEPDLSIVRGKLKDFAERHPNPDETLLVIEVSDSTLADDRGVKARMYATSGIQEYWIVNCVDRQIEVYTDPRGTGKTPRYGKLTTYLPGQAVAMHVAGKKLGEIKVNDLFGRGK